MSLGAPGAHSETIKPQMLKYDMCSVHAVMHINGVDTDRPGAERNLARLEVVYGNAHNGHKVRYGLGYNNTITMANDIKDAMFRTIYEFPSGAGRPAAGKCAITQERTKHPPVARPGRARSLEEEGEMNLKPPFRHIESDLSIDTALAAATVHRQAQEGNAIGIAMVVMYEGGFFLTHAAGECRRSPVWSFGAVAILNAKLEGIVHANGAD